jgi:hypothetical protein
MAHVWFPRLENSPPLIWRRRHGIRVILLGSAVTVALALLLSL